MAEVVGPASQHRVDPAQQFGERFVATLAVVGAAVNKRTRPESLAGVTTEQVRRVTRWVRRGEIVDDRAVAE